MHLRLNPAASQPSLRVSRRPPTKPWMAWLRYCLDQFTERRCLTQLSKDQLRDIGLSRAEIERECRRWPWDGRAWD